MGSIYTLNKNPKTWRAWDTGRKLKAEYGGEHLMTVIYGSIDDDPDGTLELDMYMRKSVYEKLVSGEYHIVPNVPYRGFTIQDKNNNIVPPVSPGFCY